MGLDGLLSEIRRSLRIFSRSPGYAGIVVATLAVGTAAVSVVMGIFSPYFLRPLPFDQADRLVHLGLVDPETGWDMARFSEPMTLDLQQHAHSFSDLGAYFYGFANLSGQGSGGAPERLMVSWVTGNTLPMLGAPAAFGRGLEESDAGREVVVLGHDLWQRRWGGDREILGRHLLIDDRPHLVVGVMRAEFSFPFNEVEAWLPLGPLSPSAARDDNGMLVVGRLADGVSIAECRVEMAALQARLAAEYPEVDGRFSGMVVKDLREALNFAWEPLQISFFLLLGAVGALLLLACLNVANLVLAREMARRHELAIRSALGGNRGAVVRPVLVESMLLAVVGGGVGLLLARAGLLALAPLAPASLFRVGDFGLDGSVTRSAVGVALLTPLFFGLLPAWKVARHALSDELRAGGRGGQSSGASRGRRVLVVVQVALAVVLVTGAALLSRSLVAVQGLDLGFDAERILAAEVEPPESRYEDAEAVTAFFDRFGSEIAAVPGIHSVSFTSRLPLNHETLTVWLAPSETELDRRQWPNGYVSHVTAGYFAAMDIPLLRGRSFESEDVDAHGVVISRSFAGQLWPGEDPVGRSILWRAGGEPRSARVVGVVGDVYFDGLAGSPPGHLYLPMGSSSRRSRYVAIATEGPPESRMSDLRGAFAALDPNLPVNLRPMTDIVRESTLQWRVSSVFLTLFGVLALGLAILGIYGVVAYSVRLRRQEIGIRMALGAERRRILLWVLAEGLLLAAWGCGAGLVLVAGLAPLLGSVLYGVGALDPISLGGVTFLLGVSAMIAALVPARQAADQPPVEVLRQD